MASSRLEKIGTIFSRVDGLIKANGMKWKERPLWYDIYKAFPPALEPKYARPVPNLPIRNIFYEEDVIRAKFHKGNKQLPGYNLSDSSHKTTTQKFIVIFNQLKSDNKTLDDDQLFNTALDLLESEVVSRKEATTRPLETVAKSESKSEDMNVNIKDLFK
ncbi:probable 28S ribosomal protein S23, mitochondrial [Ctenocephalides felis]|uniref:probable 28S ribosomal protein S23, mitochondrial n=1 Tax=Ctenocephalides felis TaxID=7515 RepID=UPI000E6E31BE|nr:probable 28S ribosomal protein S23, mitochondrial [Ctenocephalides felis]XP_026465584.1 probable 28S ribosomal protein S23, mitochondrial [Ctenocephalides felis]